MPKVPLEVIMRVALQVSDSMKSAIEQLVRLGRYQSFSQAVRHFILAGLRRHGLKPAAARILEVEMVTGLAPRRNGKLFVGKRMVRPPEPDAQGSANLG